MNKWIKALCALVLSLGFLFTSLGYAALTDTLSVSGSIVVESVVRFTVTYMVGDEVYLVEHHIDPTKDYTVVGAPNNDPNFKQWSNANGVAVTTISRNNTNDFTLYATWLNKYTINFIDADGDLVYSEVFAEGTSKLSGEGQAIVDEWLRKENAAENDNDVYVTWTSYDMAGTTGDINVRPQYDYNGYLNLVPVYEEPDDGVVDYYKVVAVDTLPATVTVPGDVGGVPVKVIDRITNIDGESDWDNYENTVTKIIIEEGVEILEWNSLAWTPNLTTVELPHSIKKMEKNVFSRNDFLGNDKKKLTISFNGTMAEWKAVVSNSASDWAGGLQEGTVINCTDGYFAYEKTNWWSSLAWREHPY